MSLNVHKIEKLLLENKFIIQAFYVINKKCQYLKIFSIKTGESIYLYISPDYNFLLEEEQSNIFETVPVNFKIGEDLIDKYSEYPNTRDMSGKYENIETIDRDMAEGQDVEAELESNYNKKIFLNGDEKGNQVLLKECFRQLKRLSLCFQDLKYKVCIFHDNYFCALETEDEITTYHVKGHHTDGKRMFFIVVTLEDFYENMMNVAEDVDMIRNNIYTILDKNQYTNSSFLEKLSKKLDQVPLLNEKIDFKKGEYLECIRKYKTLLQTVDQYESDILEKLTSLNKEREVTDTGETAYVHQKSNLEDKLRLVTSSRQKILKNMTNIKTLCNDLYLKTDKMEFDSSILINGVLKCMSEFEGVLN